MNFKIWSPLTSIPDDVLDDTRLAHVFDREVLLVSNNDEVLACGPNCSGILGLGDTAPRFSPESVDELCQKRVKRFACGGYSSKTIFVIAHCFTGAVYWWGRNHGVEDDADDDDDDDDDNDDDPDFNLKPTLMDGLTGKVIKVACGSDHCLLLNMVGEVFSWGGNGWGQLGIDSVIPIEVPTLIAGPLAGKLVTKISCGSYFSAAVLDTGEVFAWGCNDKGQIGSNTTGNQYTIPNRVSNLTNVVIKKIICGPSYMLAVTDVCELYVWGSNNNGALGLGDVVPRCVPVKNEAIGRVTNIAASYRSHTSATLTENFKVFMWGSCAGLNILVPTETVYESLHEVFAHFSKPCFMHKSMTRQSGYESVNEAVKNAFGDKESSDLTVIAEEKEIYVHRAILRMRSEYFRIFLQEHWSNENDKCVTLDQSYNAMYAYLKYLYSGKMKAEPNLALELLALADEYNDRPLKKLCEKTIQHGITIDNVASLYAIALKLNGKKLLGSCLSFAANHLSELIDSSGFDEWDLDTMKEFFRECRKRKLFRS